MLSGIVRAVKHWGVIPWLVCRPVDEQFWIGLSIIFTQELRVPGRVPSSVDSPTGALLK